MDSENSQLQKPSVADSARSSLRVNGEWIKSYIPIVVSVAALILGMVNYSNSEKYNKVNIQPILIVGNHEYVGTQGEAVTYLKNIGKGVAFLGQPNFLFDGKQVARNSYADIFATHQALIEKSKKTSECRLDFVFIHARVLLNIGDSVPFLATYGTCDPEVVAGFMERVSIDIPFSSILGHEYQMRYGGVRRI